MSLAEHVDLTCSLDSAHEQISIQKGEMASQANTIKRQERHIKRLTQMLEAAQHLSPGSPNSPPFYPTQSGVETSSTSRSKRQPPYSIPEMEPTTKKVKSFAHDLDGRSEDTTSTATEKGTNVAAFNLDGVQDISMNANVGSITVSAELE